MSNYNFEEMKQRSDAMRKSWKNSQETQLYREGYLHVEEKCPTCGERLWQKKITHWSHDHSLRTGYTLTSVCSNCDFYEVYHDVE